MTQWKRTTAFTIFVAGWLAGRQAGGLGLEGRGLVLLVDDEGEEDAPGEEAGVDEEHAEVRGDEAVIDGREGDPHLPVVGDDVPRHIHMCAVDRSGDDGHAVLSDDERGPAQCPHACPRTQANARTRSRA